jgi:hypothetical protein
MLKDRFNRTDLFAPVPPSRPRFDPPPEYLNRLLDDVIVDRPRDNRARRYSKTPLPRPPLHPGGGDPPDA